MFLSFIVPVYNALPYLEECLRSLLEQDISDYEIICVDDGSTDASGAILDAFAAAHSKIVPIHQKNSGVAIARNTGLAAAKGDYIWFVDADDFLQPNVLARLWSAIAETGCDQLVVGGFQFAEALTPEQVALRQERSLPDNVPGPGAVVWRSLIRRAFLSEHGVRFRHPELTHGEDGQFLYELSLEQPSRAEIPDTVYFYRIRPGSAETAAGRENQRRKLRSHIAVARIMQEYYRNNSDSPTANRMLSVLWYCLYGAAQLPLAEARQVLSTLALDGLFPFARPDSCTLEQSYMFKPDSLPGCVLDKLYLRLHTRWGFWLMWCLCRLKNFLRR